MELEIKGKIYSFKFGVGFLKEINSRYKEFVQVGVQLPIGFKYMVARMLDEDVEAIEDKALAAVQSIRAVADEAANQIMEAKAAPAPGTGEDLREAQFSEKMNDQDDTLVSWLNGTKRK